MSKALSKEELKRPDAFISFFSRTIDMFKKNAKIIWAVLVVLILIAAVVIIQNQRTNTLNKNASDAYASLMQSNPFEEADPSQESIVQHIEASRSFLETYAKASMAPAVQFRLAKALVTQGEYEEAKSLYEEASLALAHPYDLLAKEGVAVTLEFMDQWQESQFAWVKLVDTPNNPFQDRHLLNLALVYEKQGQTELAIETYTRILDEHPASNYLTQAQRQLSLLQP